jgi:undecaprenyl phosphate N,N'-diacetylbacillosamine 1-phosphate transferase
MYNFINRILAIFLILTTSPLFVLISVFLFLSIGHPIIFKQERSGYRGRIFNLYKFRTMSMKMHKNENLRLIKSAIFLRKFRLDELPQLYNVIRGDLVFVGPRPLLPEYNNLYNSHQAKRLNVVPGITGWAQVNGDNKISWSQKFELDVWYVKNKSILLDIKIVFLTIKFLTKKIISSDGKSLIMEKFNGKN